MQGEFPLWVKAISREIIGTFWPVAKLKGESPWTPGEVGAALGHKLAFFRGIEDAPPLKLPEDWDSPNLDKEFERRWEEWARGLISAWIETEIAIGNALVLAAKQPHHEAARFFAAFAKAYQKKPVDLALSNFHRDSTKVYMLMFIHWRWVEKMGSVAELHRGLGRLLGTHLVGDVKRIEKLCQRIGLRFRSRGRPSKKRNSDITN